VRSEGEVMRFLESRGFGFVLGDDGHKLFFHVRGAAERGVDDPPQGDRISYDVETDEQGRMRATRWAFV
jgi:cold shock CspA family protein